jgi:hypothetical protein
MQKIPVIAGKLMTCVQGIQEDLGYMPPSHREERNLRPTLT